MQKEELALICQQVILLTKETAKFLRQEAAAFDKAKIEYKGINDLVSYVDKETEKMLVKGLIEIVPQAAFITEEGTTLDLVPQDNPKNLRWIIDPLDGTTNFIHQLPIFAISIALMQEDEVIVGVVHEINRDECFYAWQGGGAFCNGSPISVSPAKSLSEGLLATGFPYYNFDRINAYLSILNELMRSTHGLRRMGSAAVDLAYVACGRFEGYFEYNLKPWDVAAGVLLVQEAGGFVGDFHGGKDYVFGRQIVAANATYAELLKIIEQHWID
jgi:myo-inositol-1(or 4)-monophosphatase